MKIFACGDVVITSGAASIVSNRIRDVIHAADYSICNLEAPVAHRGQVPALKCGPHISQCSEAVTLCRDAGFNVFSLANNHIFDYGSTGLAHTMRVIHECGGETVGAGTDFQTAYSPRILRGEGVTVGVLAAGESEFGVCLNEEAGGGYAYVNHHAIEDAIVKLKASVDFVIFLVHAGVEKTSVPLPEWRQRYKRLCDVGVDCVIGHHPHVPQGYEKYGDASIFYSLGNFYFDSAGYGDSGNESFSVVLDIDKSGMNDFEIICHSTETGVVDVVDESQAALKKMDELCQLLHEGYGDSVRGLVKELYESRYLPYYKYSMLGLPEKVDFLRLSKVFFKWIFMRDRTRQHRDLLLYHNVKIDSHRYVVQRYFNDTYGV